MKNILLTEGVGFTVSHIAVALLKADYNVVICDNLCGGRDISVLSRLKKIGKESFLV